VLVPLRAASSCLGSGDSVVCLEPDDLRACNYADDVQISGATIQNGGFETIEVVSPGGLIPWPDDPSDKWEGDEAEIVTAENGITPTEGTRMLHFLSAASQAGAGLNGSSNMWQLLNAPGSLPTTITATARFNRINVEGGTACTSPPDVPMLGSNQTLLLVALLVLSGSIAVGVRRRAQ
jgi:hypothetical protein